MGGEVGATSAYTAMVGLSADVVDGDFCDVSVLATGVVGLDEDGGEEFGLTDDALLYGEPTSVRTDAEDKMQTVGAAADEVLRANGWRRTQDWRVEDDAMTAAVERV